MSSLNLIRLLRYVLCSSCYESGIGLRGLMQPFVSINWMEHVVVTTMLLFFLFYTEIRSFLFTIVSSGCSDEHSLTQLTNILCCTFCCMCIYQEFFNLSVAKDPQMRRSFDSIKAVIYFKVYWIIYVVNIIDKKTYLYYSLDSLLH